MPNLWPFGRNKKKKSGLADEKLNAKHDEPTIAAHIAEISAGKKAPNRENINTSASTKPFDNEKQLLEKENDPAEKSPPYTSEGPRPYLERSSISSFHRTEPLVEIENLAGARENGHLSGQPHIGSLASLQPENSFTTQPLYSVPTLKSKRSSTTSEIFRSRTNRSRVNDKDREKEIKALPNAIPIPKRPASFSSGLLARDTKNVPGGLDRKLHRPTSEISLPMVESLRTSFSGESGGQQSYRVTAFNALAPRPTIKYGEHPKRKASSRASTRKEKGPAIPEEPPVPALPSTPPNPKARMNDLADNLDAKAIRELMDRDQRRRDRKKVLDHEKLQRKLQKRRDQQQAEEKAQIKAAVAAASAPMEEAQIRAAIAKASAPVEVAESPVELQGPDPTTNIPQENRPEWAIPHSRRGTESSAPWSQDSGHMSREDLDPFEDPRLESRNDVRLSSEQASIRDDAVIESATAVRLSTISMSPPASPVFSRERTMSPSNLSSVAMPPRDSPEPTSSLATSGYLSPPSRAEPSSKSGSSWTSIFRRGGTKRKVSVDKEKEQSVASEFSNVSRESFMRKAQPPTGLVVQRSFRRDDGIPQRKQSKFREDLPEFPVTPPRSRIQSPELDRPLSPYVDDTVKLSQFNNDTIADLPIEDVHPAFRDQVAVSRQHSVRDTASPEPNLLSQSLASIDSEGSWLSGRPRKQSSVRESLVSLVQPVAEQDEPDFSRRDFSDNTIRGPGGLSSQLRGIRSTATESETSPRQGSTFPYDESVKYDTVKGRRPNIIQRAPMARSREGLLEEYVNNDDDSPVSPLSPGGENDSPTADGPSIYRATSVTLGRSHARQLSAGSARLLDIPARSSSDVKRASVISAASTTKSPLSSPRESRFAPPDQLSTPDETKQ